MSEQIEMTPDDRSGEPKVTWEPEPPDWVAKSPEVNREAEQLRSRGHSVLAGFIMAALWLGISLALGLAAINLIGLAILFGGFPALWIAGRVSGLRGRRAWIRAGELGLVLTLVGAPFVGIFLTMAIYG